MKSYIYPLVSLVFLLVFSCTKKQKLSEYEVVQDYLMAYTRGTISSKESLKYIFLEPISEKDQDWDQFFTIEPKVKGVWTLVDKTQLVFTPETSYKNGEDYTVNLKLSKLNPKLFKKDLVLPFNVVEQYLNVELEGIEVRSTGQYDYVLKAMTADRLEEKEILSCISSDSEDITAVMNGENRYKIIVRYNNDLSENSRIQWNGKTIDAKESGQIKMFEMAAFQSFGVLFDKYDAITNQFSIYFSKRLDPNQNLTGMVQVEGESVNPEIRGNVLEFYLDDQSNREEVKITCSKGIQSLDGQKLDANFSFVVQTPMVKPAAQFVDKSNYIPVSQDVKIPIRTRNLKSVQLKIIEIPQKNIHHYLAWNSIQDQNMDQIFRFGRPVYVEDLSLNPIGNGNGSWEYYGIDLKDKFNKNPGALYVLSLHFGPQNTRLVCGDSFKELELSSSLSEELKKWEDSAKQGYYNYYSAWNNVNYNWNEREDPCKISYYLDNNDQMLQVQASDMGIIAKQGADNIAVAVVDLVSLKPRSEANVRVYNYQGIEILSGVTNDEGLSLFKKRDHASIIEVEHNRQIVFLSLNQNNANDLSAFPISGLGGTDRDYFLYTNRDIWRPGDSIFVNLMFNGRTTNLPDGIPLIYEFYDNNGLLLSKKKSTFKTDKLLYSFGTKTELDAKTGNYRVKVKIGTDMVQKTIPIETIKPNSIEVKYAFTDQTDRTVQSDNLKGKGRLNYLNGFPVKGAQIEVRSIVRPLNQPFPEWGDYSFSIVSESESNLSIKTTTPDDTGEYQISSTTDLKKIGSKGLLRLETQINLSGGGVNQEVQSFKVDPFSHYVGILRKKGRAWRGCFDFKNGKMDLPVIVLNRNGKLAKQNRKVNVVLRKYKKSWWMDQYSLSRKSYYRSKSKWEEVGRSTIEVRNGKGIFTHLEKDHGRGVFEVVCEDAESGHRTAFRYNVYSSNAEAEAKDSPDQLWIEQNKDECLVGEELILKFPEFKMAKTLISIEQGDKVLETFWKDVNPRNRVLSLYPDASWYPNVHIHVSLLQPYGEQSNDRPTRMYAVQALKVKQKASTLNPVLKVPEVAEVKQDFSLEVSEQNGDPMQYTLAVVDEGLLNLSGFKTPDPKKHFEGAMALQVNTWDIYKLLMNKFKGNFAAILNIGGDEAYKADIAEDFNRFKPVVKFFGPYELRNNQTKKHTVNLGDYAGKVRVMLVACNEKDFASKEEFVPVKSPLMVQTQFPRSLNIDDELVLPVTVFRENSKISPVKVDLESNRGRVEWDANGKSVTFEDNQGMVKLPLKIKGEPGKLDFKVKASGSGKEMDESTAVMVNFPNAYTSISNSQLINEQQSWEETIESLPFPDYAKHKIVISGLKLPKITSYAEDLIKYPYGCLEQTVSAGFAQLYLDQILNLSPKEKQDRERFVGATITKLRSFMDADGRFSTWRSGRYYHSWSEIYTGYFMNESRRVGFKVPDQMWNSWIKKQSTVANKWAVSEASREWIQINEERVQAYRLFVLSRSGKPVMSAMNRLSKSMRANQLNYLLLAGAYQLAGFNDRAEELLSAALQEKENFRYSYYTYGGSGRDLALIVDILSTFDNKKDLLQQYYFYMVDQLNARNYANTHTKAYAFMACSRYLQENKASFEEEIHFQVDMNGEAHVYRKSYWEPLQLVFGKDQFGKEIKVKNLGKADLVVDHVKRFVPTEIITENESKGIVMNVSLANQSLNQLVSPLQIKMGEEQLYTVRITNPGPLEIKSLALNLKMPAGLELMNPRVNPSIRLPQQSSYEYQDYRDDRVYTFFSLAANDTKTFYFKAIAAFEGRFLQPAVRCEHMYNGDINATVKSNTILVE